MEAGPPDVGSFVQDVDDETLLAAARNEEGENEFVEDVADVLLNEVGEAFDRQFSYQSELGGAALSSSAPAGSFEFLLDPFVDRRSERMGVRERHYTTRLRQRSAFIPSQHVPSALTEALHAAVRRLIEQDHVPAQDRVYLGLSSNRLSHAYNYRGLTADQWLRGGARVDALLQKTSAMLNSNEQFEMDDSFQLSFAHVRTPPTGSGRKRKLKPGHSALTSFKKKKLSVLLIKNGDELCCARAIVTAKARLDQHPNWDGFKRPGRRLRGAAAGLATVHSNEDDVPSTSLLPSPPADGVDLNDEKPPLHIFFDVEAMQDTGRHVPNLVVAETENDERPVRFRGDSCMREFLEWLDTLTEEDSREVKVLAHNFQGYDGYFVVEEYHRQHRIVQQLRNGAKLLQVTFDRITFIDSLSFFQMPLSAFPKTFGLTELKKGYFPHLFNTLSNQSYVGRIPDTSYFMPDVMSVSARRDFEAWHTRQRVANVIYDLQKELTEYCESDVKLLKQGCLSFKSVFEPLARFNPFSHITIASACNRDLRQNRVEADTIANEPLHGWRLNTNHSRVALEWLHWQQHQLPDVDDYIRHAGNSGEYRIPHSRHTVDGYHEKTNTVYEF